MTESNHSSSPESGSGLVGKDREEDNITTRNNLESETDAEHKRQKLPWWKRPSPVWLLVAMPVTSIAMSCTTAPRIEVYTTLACGTLKPEHSSHDSHRLGPLRSPLNGVSFMPFYPAYDAVHFNDPGKTGFPRITVHKDPEETRKLCASDPVVQAAVAKLSVAMTAAKGVLSCLTSAWWGSVSDRRGRTFVLWIHMISLLFTDLSFILALCCSQYLPGGYWFLLLGPIAEGAFGGFVGATAAMHAYLADCTTANSRSRIFSLSLGLLFMGMAVGPTLGGLLIRATKRTVSVFIAACVVHIVYTIFLSLILPESLPSAQMVKSRQRYDETEATVAREWAESGGGLKVLLRLRRAFRFLSPLSIFWPGLEKKANPLKGRSRDWGLILFALAFGCTVSISAAQTSRFQYAASTFGWSSEALGYWLTLVGTTRAIYTTLVLPVIIKYFKPKPASVQVPVEPGEATPLLTATSSTQASSTSLSASGSQPLRKKDIIHSTAFDLGLVRASVVIDLISYTLMALISSSAAFTIFAMTGALGAGFAPAAQSVALDMYARRGGTETGRLFGALSVVQALCSEILAPAMYGLTYMATVQIFPRAFFFLVVASLGISFICLSFVRLGNESSMEDAEEVFNVTQTTLGDDDAEDEDAAISKSNAISVTNIEELEFDT